MRIFCTLFDKNYLYQGIALHNSLKRFSNNFRLYALCMDSTAYTTLMKMKSESLFPISIEELMNPEIMAVRNRTTHGQFCWVCQPLICEYILDKFKADMVTYLEADSLFFADPEILFEELGEKSVSLVPHNYSPGFDHTDISGKYCVQFNAFRNNESAREVLEYWRSWCFKYDKNSPRSVPGQISLNDWPDRFDCVKVIEHLGAGVAPWNIQQAKFEVLDSAPYLNSAPVIFYHYHQYGRYANDDHELGHYPLTVEIINYFYKKYVDEIRVAEAIVHDIDPSFSYRREYQNNVSLIELLKSFTIRDARRFLAVIRRKIRGRYNVFPDAYFALNTQAGHQ